MKLTELKIYQLAVQLRNEVHRKVHTIPFFWKNADVQQIMRSSSSVPSNIAEGYSRKYYPKDFIRFLSIAIGSSDESRHHINALNSDGLLSADLCKYFINAYKDLSIRIVNFRNKIRKSYNLK